MTDTPELFEFIDDLPLTARHTELLGMSALHTLIALQRFFDALLVEKRAGPVTAERHVMTDVNRIR